ncbi:hypothetical protein ACFU7T_33600 [Streptomyces sp. NPDC057555]|uniref:hypothetical protein n=1 Tax=Streptomyces sp. NPDC057555 TaxID=3346166 RepID=UPI0036C9F5E0
MFRHAFLSMPSAVAVTAADAPKAAAGRLATAPAIDDTAPAVGAAAVALAAAAVPATAPAAAARTAAAAADGARS